MSICDVCNETVLSGARVYTADQMRHAARLGFRPPQSTLDTMAMMASMMGGKPEDFIQNWLNQINSDTTDWSLCRDCSSRLKTTIKTAKPSGFCAFCKQPIYPKQQIAMLNENAIVDLVNRGVILQPGAPSGTDPLGNVRWVACMSCMHNIEQRLQR